MSMSTKKLLSIVLCICMLVGLCQFNLAISAADTTPKSAVPTEYYVKFGGSGDGRSENAPAGSIPAVISAINTDGHTTGDLVTVYVIDSGEGSLKVINSNVLLGYDPQGLGSTPEHSATIKWTSYKPDEVTSIIGHTGYLSW
ncbi:MAG: hypothetical protein IKV98_05800, partial [Clostridia bacterium]|nr:hypothetical protein [Clostridia bacterium]